MLISYIPIRLLFFISIFPIYYWLLKQEFYWCAIKANIIWRKPNNLAQWKRGWKIWSIVWKKHSDPDLNEKVTYLYPTQCGNLAIFLPLWFYVKSILTDFRSSKPAILTIQDALNLIFWYFHIWDSKLLRLVKWQFLTFWNQPKLISHKIRVAEKCISFHTVLKSQDFSW